MSPSFMSLPLEIRLQIYRYLLSDWEYVFYLHSAHARQVKVLKLLSSVSGWEKTFEFQPAVLRCSRQICNEAINVLYGENCFRLENVDGPPSRMVEFPINNLRLIRHLRVLIWHNGSGEKLPNFAGTYVRTCLALLHYSILDSSTSM